MKRWSEDETSQLLSLTRERSRQRSVGPEWRDPSTLKDSDSIVQQHKILGLCPNASTHSRVSRGTTHRIVGDRLHIPWLPPIALIKDFTCLGTILNNHKHRLLRRTSDSLPGQITDRVSRLHEEEVIIPQSKCYKAKQAIKFKELRQLKYLKKSNSLVNKSTIKSKRKWTNSQPQRDQLCKAQRLKYVSHTYKTKVSTIYNSTQTNLNGLWGIGA